MAKKQQSVTVTPRMRRIYSLRKNAKINANINANISAGLARMEAKAAEQLFGGCQPVWVIEDDNDFYSPLVVLYAPASDPETWDEDTVARNIRSWQYCIIDRRVLHKNSGHKWGWVCIYWEALEWCDTLDEARKAFRRQCKWHADDAAIDGDDDWYVVDPRGELADQWYNEYADRNRY